MMEKQTPTWLQELLDQDEAASEKRNLEMNKIRADQVLGVIGSIEEKISEIEQIAEQEINLISTWRDTEVIKLQNKINWLSFNLEKFIRSSGDSTINLAHGVIKMRKSRDKVEILDEQKFLPIAKRLGLVRHIEAKDEPDMNALRAYLKTNGGKPLPGLMLTVGTPTFSFTTNKKGATNAESERTETESGSSSTREQTADIAA